MPTTEPINPMPEARRDLEIVLRLMREHGLGNRDLADATGLSDSYISRMLSGQYPVHLAVVRWLHALTRDAELRRFLLGDGEHLTVTLPSADKDRADVPTLMVPLARDWGELNSAAAAAIHDRSTSQAQRVDAAAHRAIATALRFTRAAKQRLETTA